MTEAAAPLTPNAWRHCAASWPPGRHTAPPRRWSRLGGRRRPPACRRPGTEKPRRSGPGPDAGEPGPFELLLGPLGWLTEQEKIRLEGQTLAFIGASVA